MPLDKRPDAVIYPVGYFPAGVSGLQSANKVFGPVLRCSRVAVGDQSLFNFARPHPASSRPDLMFPEGHPRAKQDRYAWFEAHRDAKGDWFLGDERDGHADRDGSTVLFGYVLPDQDADDESVLASVVGARADAAEQYRRAQEALPKEERIARVDRLRSLGLIDDDEADKQIRRIKAGPKPKGEDEPVGADVSLIEEKPKGDLTDE